MCAAVLSDSDKFFRRGHTMHKIIFAVILALTFLQACNTMEGMGRDIRSAGGALEGSAEKHKAY